MTKLAAPIILLVLAVGACGGGYNPSDYSSYMNPQWDSSNEVGQGINVTDCYVNFFNLTWGGTLKNLTDFPLANVKLGLDLMKDGEVVATDSIIAVGKDGLAPGEQTQWVGMIRSAPSYDYCYVKVLDHMEVR